MFKRLFSKSKSPILFDYSTVKTDVHSHLIPGIDDGSKSLQESMELLQNFQELGYKKVITTPHVMSDFYKNTSDIILSGLEQVQTKLLKSDLDIQIEAAAEYYLDFHFEELIKKKDILFFGEQYVLFELSFTSEPNRVMEVIFDLQMAGYKPILAHLERYPYYANQWGKIEEIRSAGCLIQMNINSLSGQYGSGVTKMAEQLINKQKVDVLGSDCHHMRHLEGLETLKSNPHLAQLIASSQLINPTL